MPIYKRNIKELSATAVMAPRLVLPSKKVEVKNTDKKASAKRRGSAPFVYGSTNNTIQAVQNQRKMITRRVGKKFFLLKISFCLSEIDVFRFMLIQ